MAKTKLNDKLQEDLVDLIIVGASFEDACGALGITTQTMRNWEKRGKEAKSGKYYNFWKAMEKARVDAKINLIKKMTNSNDWKASWQILKSRYPDEFHENNKYTIQGSMGLNHSVNDLFDEEKMQKILDQEEGLISDGDEETETGGDETSGSVGETE